MYCIYIYNNKELQKRAFFNLRMSVLNRNIDGKMLLMLCYFFPIKSENISSSSSQRVTSIVD